MVKKVGEEYREEILEFLSAEESINLFIIGDIENYGFNKDFMDIWIGTSDNGAVRSILLRYFDNFLCYYKELSNDINEYKEIIKGYKGTKRVISGKSDIVEEFLDVFNKYKKVDTNFCEINSKEKLRTFSNKVKIAIVEDTDRIYNLLSNIDEFVTVSEETRKNIKVTLEAGTGRVYYIEDNEGNIISQAQSSAECSKAAMVVGVATMKEYRNKGLVGECISKLCSDILDENKKLCLFYENPIAGKLYKNIGFIDTNKWTMIIEE